MIYDATIYDKWRRMLIRHCVIIACVISISEIIIIGFYYFTNLNSLSLPYLFLRYFIVPSIINIVAILVGRAIILSPKYEENTKNYTAILVLCLICACVQCFHYIFPAVMCSSCIPIFLTILFKDKKMTMFIQMLSYIFIILSGTIAKLGSRRNDPQLVYDCLVASTLLICSCIVSMILIKYEKQRTKDVNICYSKQMELSEQLKHDLLTGLYNYQAFLDILKQKSKNSKNRLQIAVLDLDNFKYINDTYGHINGNEVLIYISYLLKKYTSNIGYPARYGGEEFVVLFTNFTIDEAYNIMETIRKDFSEHYFDFSQGKKFTFSCGLAENTCNGITFQEFFESADRAMYLAKRSGKNKTVVAKKQQCNISSL